MILKIFNGQSKTITGAALVISGATLASRLVGVVRDRVFAHYFSAGVVTDAYFAAFKVPDLIYNLLIAGALTAGFIPTFTKLFYQSNDKTAAWRLANNCINILGVALITLCGLGIIFTRPLSFLIAPGFHGEAAELVVTFSRIMFLSPLLLGISMVMGGVLQSLRHFFLYSIAPIFYNIGIIIGATVLTKSTLGIRGLAAGVVLGALLHASIQIYGAYSNGYRWQWRFDVKDAETKLIWKLMIPRTLGLSITQLNIVVVTVLASLLPAGSVAVFNYANNLQAVPTGIIGIPFAIAVFPLLSKAFAENDQSTFAQNISATMRQILFLVIPASLLVMLLRAQIVRTVLGSGAFDWNATVATADTLAFFALGLFAQSLIPLFARAFYAQSNSKTPFVLGVIAELISIIVALVCMRSLGVAGLALASSVGAIINCVFLGVALRQRLQDFDTETVLRSLYKIIIATIFMGIVVQLLKYPLAAIFDQHYFWGILAQGVVAGMAGIVVYVAICYSVKLPELLQIRDSLHSRWLRLRQLPTNEGIEIKE